MSTLPNRIECDDPPFALCAKVPALVMPFTLFFSRATEKIKLGPNSRRSHYAPIFRPLQPSLPSSAFYDQASLRFEDL